jgi:hypothetical protein
MFTIAGSGRNRLRLPVAAGDGPLSPWFDGIRAQVSAQQHDEIRPLLSSAQPKTMMSVTEMFRQLLGAACVRRGKRVNIRAWKLRT